MVELYAFRRSLHFVVLAVYSVAMVAIATPASARSHHGGRHSHAHHARRHHGHRRYRHMRMSRGDAGVALMQMRGFAGAKAGLASGSVPVDMAASGGFGSSNIVAEARRFIGGNPTSRSSLWCARFMNMVLQRSGYRGTGSDAANSFASYGRRVSGPQIGAIAVMSRRGGGHVGIVSGIDAAGNPILVSGNHRNRVAESPYPRGRIYAYVMPTS
jgi:uncharacterized protein (TIGR02594 family)